MDGAHQNYISMPGACSFDNASSVHVVAHDNKVFAPDADARVSGCGGDIPFDQWMQVGVDHGSSLGPLPSNEAVVAMGMATLGLA